MATIKRFEELECWQEARKLVGVIYALTKKSGFKNDFELRNQVVRSATSVMANIAEGFHRSSRKDFLKFLDYSRSSIAETLSHCYISLDQQYISDSEMQAVNDQTLLVWKKINAFIAYLDGCETGNKNK